jgi:hypothetical protein
VICATACRGLRASVEEEPTAGTRWRGGVGERVREHLHRCQGGCPSPGVGRSGGRGSRGAGEVDAAREVGEEEEARKGKGKWAQLLG